MENFIPPLPTILVSDDTFETQNLTAFQRYDLKGSSKGRCTTEEEIMAGGIGKDLNFHSFVLGSDSASAFHEQLYKDTQVSQSESLFGVPTIPGSFLSHTRLWITP
jgi:hypothetical protein